MKEIKEKTYKGTRILLGNEKRTIIVEIDKSIIEAETFSGYTQLQNCVGLWVALQLPI